MACQRKACGMISAAASALFYVAGAIALASLAHSIRAAVLAWRALMETRPYD